MPHVCGTSNERQTGRVAYRIVCRDLDCFVGALSLTTLSMHSLLGPSALVRRIYFKKAFANTDCIPDS